MTELDIVNYALDRLGAMPATSMTDTARNAKLAIRNYPMVRDKVMRLYEWPSMVKREALALVTNTPKLPYPSGMQYVYGVPPDCARIMEVEYSGDKLQYIREGDLIYTTVPEANIRYLKAGTNPNDWDPLVQSAIALLLASEIAIAVTSKQELQAGLYQEFMINVNAAAGVEFSQSSSVPDHDALWTDN